MKVSFAKTVYPALFVNASVYNPGEGYKSTAVCVGIALETVESEYQIPESNWFVQNPDALVDGTPFSGGSITDANHTWNSVFHQKTEIYSDGCVIMDNWNGYPSPYENLFYANRKMYRPTPLRIGDSYKVRAVRANGGRQRNNGMTFVMLDKGQYSYMGLNYKLWCIAQLLVSGYPDNPNRSYVTCQYWITAVAQTNGVWKRNTGSFTMASPSFSGTYVDMNVDDAQDYYGELMLVDATAKQVNCRPSSYAETMSTESWNWSSSFARWIQSLQLTSTLDWDAIKRSESKWNNMSFNALQDIGLWTGNGIAFLKDAIELPSLARSTVSLAKDLGSMVSMLMHSKSKYMRGLGNQKLSKKRCQAISLSLGVDQKTLRRYVGKPVATLKQILGDSASAYLQEHYAWRLSAIDTAELSDMCIDLAHSLDRHQVSRARSTHEFTLNDGTTCHQAFEVLYSSRPEQLTDFAAFTQEYDLHLDLSNLWDMVPYSFVIDWFTNLGDCLTAFDNVYRLRNNYKTYCCVESIKATRRLAARGTTGAQPLNADVYVSGYARKIVRNIPDPIPDNIVTTFKPFDHMVEAGALIVQKIL